VTKSKTIATALVALTLATTFTAIGGQAQAHSHFGRNVGWGIAAGVLAGAAVASSSYYYAPGYRDCRYVERMDRFGYIRTIKVCEY
jgi:hypothetical protein